ncbi:MAG: dicarboxylate/amino acid:cation symporter [Spirochaetaceae bacterium]
MKTLLQVLAGLIVGALIALLLPVNSLILTTITQISTTILSMGRYIVLPLLFFSLIVSVCQLQRNRQLAVTTAKAIGLVAAFSLLLVIIGILVSFLFPSGPIPVVIDGIYEINVPSFKQLIEQSFPSNIFSVFVGEFTSVENQFVPFFILALVLGFFLTKSSREEVEPTFNLVDSLSRIFFKINEYFLKISFIWVTILTATYINLIRDIFNIVIFLPLIITLISLTVFIVFIVYPIIFYYTCGKRNSFKYILSQMPTLIVAVITGDYFFTSTTLIASQKLNFKIKREVSGFNIPFLSLFSKSGTALVSVITFIVILKSYSSLEITASQVLWVSIFSFLISFCLPTKAVGSSVASLYLLCSLYAYGNIEDSYIILSPVFPVLAAVSTIINSATIILINVMLDPDKKLQGKNSI